MFKYSAFSVLVFLLFSCGGEEALNDSETNDSLTNEVVYSCAVAGHVYGSSTYYTESIHPPFLKKIKELNESMDIQSLVLTGDVVVHARPSQWDSTVKQLDSLQIPWYIAPGNHDVDGGFKENVQSSYYLSFQFEDHLFLVLNTSYEGWKPDSAQQLFIQEELEKVKGKDEASVFVFSHQLWWQKDAPDEFELDSVRTNSYALFDGKESFWDVAFPFFEELENDIYFFGGDLGCEPVIKSYYEDHYQNFHFYGSGMGSRSEDNFLLIQIYQDRAVKIQRIDF
ncbi:MAG: metallophosphoesterase [Flavobacteriales bacterium]|nr:metallophosphoesterase [Flavobacteriales bacterium]